MSSSSMSGKLLRRAGTGTLADGSVVTWSVAEGSRGRRWRWTVALGEQLRHAGLVELDRDGRFARLELETANGMLTLHPDSDRRSAHGNVVRTAGVEPVSIDWMDDEGVAIEDDPFGSAVAGWRGRGWVVGPELRLHREHDQSRHALPLDGRGIPLLDDAREFALEV